MSSDTLEFVGVKLATRILRGIPFRHLISSSQPQHFPPLGVYELASMSAILCQVIGSVASNTVASYHSTIRRWSYCLPARPHDLSPELVGKEYHTKQKECFRYHLLVCSCDSLLYRDQCGQPLQLLCHRYTRCNGRMYSSGRHGSSNRIGTCPIAMCIHAEDGYRAVLDLARGEVC